MLLDRRLFLALFPVPFFPATALTVLSAHEASLIEALCAQIIPADEYPGAKEAGVLYYIETQLAGPFANKAETYHAGLDLLNKECLARTSQVFTALPFPEQTAFLREIDREPASPLAKFFALVVDHTMQGFYGSPKHGGNRDEASWKMLAIADVMEGHKHDVISG